MRAWRSPVLTRSMQQRMRCSAAWSAAGPGSTASSSPSARAALHAACRRLTAPRCHTARAHAHAARPDPRTSMCHTAMRPQVVLHFAERRSAARNGGATVASTGQCLDNVPLQRDQSAASAQQQQKHHHHHHQQHQGEEAGGAHEQHQEGVEREAAHVLLSLRRVVRDNGATQTHVRAGDTPRRWEHVTQVGRGALRSALLDMRGSMHASNRLSRLAVVLALARSLGRAWGPCMHAALALLHEQERGRAAHAPSLRHRPRSSPVCAPPPHTHKPAGAAAGAAGAAGHQDRRGRPVRAPRGGRLQASSSRMRQLLHVH